MCIYNIYLSSAASHWGLHQSGIIPGSNGRDEILWCLAKKAIFWGLRSRCSCHSEDGDVGSWPWWTKIKTLLLDRMRQIGPWLKAIDV